MMIRNGPPPQQDFVSGVRPAVPDLISPSTSTPGESAYDVFHASQMEWNSAASAIHNTLYNMGPTMSEHGMPELDEHERTWEEYSPYDDDVNLEGYPPGIFVKSRSPAETDRLKREHDSGLERQKILDNAGAYGIMNEVAAGVLQPLSLIPLYGFSGMAQRASLNMLKASGTVGATETLNEYILHQYDSSRTMEESAINTVGAAAFGGVLGGILSKAGLTDELLDVERKFLKENMEINRRNPDRKIVRGAKGRFESQVPKLSERAEVGQIKGIIPKMAAHLTPIRTLASDNPLSRVLGSLLGEQTVVGTSRAAIETLLTRMEGSLGNSIRTARKSYYAAVKDPSVGSTSYRTFQAEVAHALRNGDVHPNPHVQAATKQYRQILESMKKDSVKYGVLGEGDTLTKFAKSYFPRVYNTGKIKSDPVGFQQDISAWLLKENPKMKPEELNEASQGLYRDLTTNNYQADFHKMYVPKSGPMKDRKVAIPDNVLEKYLVNEPEAVIRQYTRHVGARNELARRFGDESLEKEFAEVDNKWSRMITTAQKEGASERTIRKMNRQRDRDSKDLVAMRDRLLNRYGMPEDPGGFFIRAGRTARNLNGLRLLGGMTLSAMPDLARPLWKHGLSPYVKGTRAILGSKELRNMAKADLQRMGVGLDLVLDQRLRSMAELDFNPYGVSKFEQGIEMLTQGTGHVGSLKHGEGIPDMGRMSLMSYWNASLKMLSGVLSQDGLSRKVLQPHKYVNDLGRAGIDEGMARRIAAELDANMTTERGLRFGNSDKWKDMNAAEAYETAILKEVDSTIVTPGVMDRPKWMSSEQGKLIGQVKSFAFASTNRQFLTAISQADARVFQGIIASTMMGTLSLYIKGMIAGKAVEQITGDNPLEFMWEGMVHSGAIGIGSELYDIAGSAVGENANQYTLVQNLMGKMLGPSAGFVGDSVGAAFGDEASLRRMIPYNNLFYMRRFIDPIVED